MIFWLHVGFYQFDAIHNLGFLYIWKFWGKRMLMYHIHIWLPTVHILGECYFRLTMSWDFFFIFLIFFSRWTTREWAGCRHCCCYREDDNTLGWPGWKLGISWQFPRMGRQGITDTQLQALHFGSLEIFLALALDLDFFFLSSQALPTELPWASCWCSCSDQTPRAASVILCTSQAELSSISDSGHLWELVETRTH